MESLLVKIALALLPVPAVYLLYRHYLISYRQSYLVHLESFFYGMALAVVLLAVASFTLLALHLKNPFLIGFLKAALIEKGGAFLLLYFLIKRRGSNIIIVESVAAAIMLGIGFSAVENLVYAMDHSMMRLVVRFFSSVPLHATTCGMMGYYLSIAFSCRAPALRRSLIIRAILLPFFLHGLFDSFLLSGGLLTYWIGPLLVLLVVMLEFMLARAQTLPPLELLTVMELSFEDWSLIQREPQYERWILRSMGGKTEIYDSFFKWHLRIFRLLIIFALIAGALAFLPFRETIVSFLKVDLKIAEQITLFSVLPFAFALNLLVVGAINPQYFRNSIIRIPIIAESKIFIGRETEEGYVYDQSVNAITYDINGFGCFSKTVEEIPTGSPVQLKFICPGFESPLLNGISIWDNHQDPEHPAGTMIRFPEMPQHYRRFLLRYAFFKFIRGILFNLRLPGFEAIRRFFVQPLSVMQRQSQYPAGTLLFEEGDTGKDFYHLRKGTVEIYKTLDNGERVVMTELGEGAIFGEMSIMSGHPRAASARCRTNCTLAVATGDNLDALIKNNPDFTYKLISVLINRLHCSEEILTGNIHDQETESDLRNEILIAGAEMMLIGAGFNPSHGTIPVKIDFERIRRYCNVNEETARTLFQFLMRYENLDQMTLEEMRNYIGSELGTTRKKYLLLIEEQGIEE